MQITLKPPDRPKFRQALEIAGGNTRPLMVAWSVEVGNQARKNAMAHGGRSFWRREVAGSVQEDVTGPDTATVYSTSPIAHHVHEGGIIRPKNGRMLAIPLTDEARKRWPREWPADELFIIRRRNGDKDQAVLARKKGKRGIIENMYVLKSWVDQDPRPWWPDDRTVLQLGEKAAGIYIRTQEKKFNAAQENI